jgi:hypothetical protein
LLCCIVRKFITIEMHCDDAAQRTNPGRAARNDRSAQLQKSQELARASLRAHRELLEELSNLALHDICTRAALK